MTWSASRMREWRAKNPDKAKRQDARTMDRQRATRSWLAQIKIERGCEFVLPDGSVCGWREHPAALDFDHRDPAMKKFILSRGTGRPRDALLAEIAKCDVICANHHRVRSAEDGHFTFRRFSPPVAVVLPAEAFQFSLFQESA